MRLTLSHIKGYLTSLELGCVRYHAHRSRQTWCLLNLCGKRTWLGMTPLSVERQLFNTMLCSSRNPFRLYIISVTTRLDKLLRMLSGWNNWWRLHGRERITKTKRWKTHCRDLQHGSWSSGSSISLHNSSSSPGDSQTTYWNTHWTLCCRSVTDNWRIKSRNVQKERIWSAKMCTCTVYRNRVYSCLLLLA